MHGIRSPPQICAYCNAFSCCFDSVIPHDIYDTYPAKRDHAIYERTAVVLGIEAPPIALPHHHIILRMTQLESSRKTTRIDAGKAACSGGLRRIPQVFEENVLNILLPASCTYVVLRCGRAATKDSLL